MRYKTIYRLQMNDNSCGIVFGCCTCGSINNIDALDFYQQRESDLRKEVGGLFLPSCLIFLFKRGRTFLTHSPCHYNYELRLFFVMIPHFKLYLVKVLLSSFVCTSWYKSHTNLCSKSFAFLHWFIILIFPFFFMTTEYLFLNTLFALCLSAIFWAMELIIDCLGVFK